MVQGSQILVSPYEDAGGKCITQQVTQIKYTYDATQSTGAC